MNKLQQGLIGAVLTMIASTFVAGYCEGIGGNIANGIEAAAVTTCCLSFLAIVVLFFCLMEKY